MFNLTKATSLLGFWLLPAVAVFASTISGTVRDPSGAVISQARIEISGHNLAGTIVLSSDGVGKFVSHDLQPGKYTLQVTHEGFEPLEHSLDLRESADVQLTLEIAKVQTSISVPGKSGAYANTDPVYRQLRAIGLGDTFRVDGFTLISDVATFHFEKGTLTFLSPVEGVVTGAIFIGDGHLTLKPLTEVDLRELKRRIDAERVDEEFTEVMFRFRRLC